MKTIVISISDSRDAENDASGDLLVGLLSESGAKVIGKLILTDDRDELAETLRSYADRNAADLIITTGGTGLAPRDNTPEATRSVIEKEAPGLAEAMRRETAVNTPMAMLSRAVCGIRGKTLIINLPGSPRAVVECFEVIKPVLGHAVAVLKGENIH